MKKYKLLIDIPAYTLKIGDTVTQSDIDIDYYRTHGDLYIILPRVVVENSPQVFQLVDEDEEFQYDLNKLLYDYSWHSYGTRTEVDNAINEITKLAKKHFGGGG